MAAPRTPTIVFALLVPDQAPGLEIVGVSTVFGNAPLDVTDRTTRDLMAAIGRPVTGCHLFTADRPGRSPGLTTAHPIPPPPIPPARHSGTPWRMVL